MNKSVFGLLDKSYLAVQHVKKYWRYVLSLSLLNVVKVLALATVIMFFMGDSYEAYKIY